MLAISRAVTHMGTRRRLGAVARRHGLGNRRSLGHADRGGSLSLGHRCRRGDRHGLDDLGRRDDRRRRDGCRGRLRRVSIGGGVGVQLVSHGGVPFAVSTFATVTFEISSFAISVVGDPVIAGVDQV